MLTFYGLGTIVGGGFYALAGKVSVQAGMLTPVAFVVASLIAMFSAFSYAELSARYPYSAGEAHYVLAAFRKVWPSAMVGWAVIATGVVSAATLAVAFAGFVRSLVDVPEWLVVCAMVIGLGLVAAWGIWTIRNVGIDHHGDRAIRALGRCFCWIGHIANDWGSLA